MNSTNLFKIPSMFVETFLRNPHFSQQDPCSDDLMDGQIYTDLPRWISVKSWVEEFAISIHIMWFWAWKLYLYTLIDLCRAGITRRYDESPGAAMVATCWPFDTEKWENRKPVGFVLDNNGCWEFTHLLITDETDTVFTLPISL